MRQWISKSAGNCCRRKSVSSLYPAKADIDVVVTGNGKQRIDVIGDPYHERIIFKKRTNHGYALEGYAGAA